jgi:hypothetical protein
MELKLIICIFIKQISFKKLVIWLVFYILVRFLPMDENQRTNDCHPSTDDSCYDARAQSSVSQNRVLGFPRLLWRSRSRSIARASAISIHHRCAGDERNALENYYTPLATDWFVCVFLPALQMAHAKRLPVDAVAAAARSKPNLLREIFTGLGLGVFCESRILCVSLSLCPFYLSVAK